MDHSIQGSSDLTHAKLESALYPVAKRFQDTRRRELRNRALLFALLASAAIAAIAFLSPGFAEYSLVLTFAVASTFVISSFQKEKRVGLDYLAAARAIEKQNPDLKQALVTSVEQQLSGESGFFADHVTHQALASPTRDHWYKTGIRETRNSVLTYFGAMAGIVLCMLATYNISNRAAIAPVTLPETQLASTNLLVEPGDVEIERGASLVVTARFEGPLPQDVSLEILDDSGTSQTLSMARSLSDPVFAYSLRAIDQPVRYRIKYRTQASALYRISTYDLPELTQADARLDFPDYTGWGERTIEDTLRISAIEGTQLTYRFSTNKKVSSAYLVDEAGERTDLTGIENTGTRFQLQSTLSKSGRYTLHLLDEAGRKNSYPPEIRIESILNERPNLRLETPRGDQRLSALEEVSFSGTATDDFGLLDYGIGFAIAAQEQDELSLASERLEPESLSERLDYLLALEDFELQAKDTLSWYLWAKDFGPDGKIRHTTSDLYFADIRNFDEVFKEQDQGAGGQSQAANQGLELLEKQRRIVISLFRIKNTATNPTAATDDLDVLQRSQVEALEELQQLIPQLEEATSMQHATEAQRFMEGVDLGLTRAIDRPSLEPLDLAWSDAQNAYDKLVKLSNDEFNVSRSSSPPSGSGGGASRNQSQINELDFRQEDSRYETASEAQALSSPEERQDLELIGKLNELSRRQDDLNERLQEMQSELANANSAEERERIERELKRLEQEQREMMADADEAIQQAGNRQSARQARQQLEEARETMQEASEQLEEGQVSQALASGTRAQDTLEKTREQMREANSSEFSEAMREARTQARDLATAQAELEAELAAQGQETRRSLGDDAANQDLAQRIAEQSDNLGAFLDDLREVAEDSENVEPGLFRELYRVLRDSSSSRFEERYDHSLQYLEQGFAEEARREQQGLADDLEKLSEAVDKAAEGILGSEGATMQFAQSEIDSLSEQLDGERAQSQGQRGQAAREGGSGPGEGSPMEQFRQALNDFGQPGNAPLTGGDFGEWIERLSTVESLLEEPLARARVSEAREAAEEMRRDFKRHGKLPQWEMIVDQISVPLNEVSSWLASELSRIENPDTLQSIDRDPVPAEYSEVVQRYYESLGND